MLQKKNVETELEKAIDKCLRFLEVICELQNNDPDYKLSKTHLGGLLCN